MRILVVDESTESQAATARRIQSFDAADLEQLDISVNLSGLETLPERVRQADVLVIGPELEDRARSIATQARIVNPTLEILLFVADESYREGAFRMVHQIRARKVFPQTVSQMDLLQEFVLIHEDFRVTGRVKDCRVIAINHAKGSVGATTLCAALGELVADSGRRVLLWDMDCETKDLSRSFTVASYAGAVVSTWISGARLVSRESLLEALLPLSPTAALLTPPDQMAARIDWAGSYDAVPLVNRVVELARLTHDCIIIDLAGRVGPTTNALMLAANTNVLVLDDSVLGLSAMTCLVESIRETLIANGSVRFLCSGTRMPLNEIRAKVDLDGVLPAAAWDLPAIPYDGAAAGWPGSGKTLYSLGSKVTRRVLGRLGVALELTPPQRAGRLAFFRRSGRASAAWSGGSKGLFGDGGAAQSPAAND